MQNRKQIIHRIGAVLLAAVFCLTAASCTGTARGSAAEGDCTCTLEVRCDNILKNLQDLDPEKVEIVPSDGVVLPVTEVRFSKGTSVFDILKDTLPKKGIHLEYSGDNTFGTMYIEGIANLYEFDCGPMSGWTYQVNGEAPTYGCSSCFPENGDAILFAYTCDLGLDCGIEYEPETGKNP